MPDNAHAPLGSGHVAGRSPAFLITIDTEGDDLWSKPRDITVRNAESLPRFQELCEKYGLKPTYLTNWEMATAETFVEFGRSVLERDTAEIGMHLHAWNSPPLAQLTDDDFRHQPYLIEYPAEQLREKVKVMTDTLENTFNVKMRSHRAGRWGLNELYIEVLVQAGYLVDCSVTPHVDWRPHPGSPTGPGGPDFRLFPESAYFMDPEDISRPGSSPLLQLPMTIVSRYGSPATEALRGSLRRIPKVGRYAALSLPSYWWLRPNGRNGAKLLKILSLAADQQRDYVEFMLHSSELMAGGSPTFRTGESIEALFDDLEALFDAATGRWKGSTLSEYRERWSHDGQTGFVADHTTKSEQ